MTRSFKFSTWNMRQNGSAVIALRKVEYLRALDWDVLALQEVTPAAAGVIAESGLAEQWICPPFAVHGVSLAARNGIRMTAPALMADLPLPGTPSVGDGAGGRYTRRSRQPSRHERGQR